MNPLAPIADGSARAASCPGASCDPAFVMRCTEVADASGVAIRAGLFRDVCASFALRCALAGPRFTGRQGDRESRGRGLVSFSTWTLVVPSGNVKRSRARTSCGSRSREHFTFPSEGEISDPVSIVIAHLAGSPSFGPRPSGEGDRRYGSSPGHESSGHDDQWQEAGRAQRVGGQRPHSAPSTIRSRQGRQCLCGRSSQVAREAQICVQNALRRFARGDEGPGRSGDRTSALPLDSLSPCLPVNLVQISHEPQRELLAATSATSATILSVGSENRSAMTRGRQDVSHLHIGPSESAQPGPVVVTFFESAAHCDLATPTSRESAQAVFEDNRGVAA